ncbi:hypothetical protein EHF33_14335 [Deinococcus psychrotolerans]|uniref:Uncharacterized protein n=1 Tax=Deinococcus psychrotolerans TaxID=2489213 RepID=A0A3G8YGY0_9DEIO|nr:hypothetical protein [Deinococcus psychrotolerans]AZI44090.1 hypothetical protein EHF33_14335 [Deinococcus psychrotolerans]
MTFDTQAQRHAARARLLSWLLKPADDFGAALHWLAQVDQVCAETEVACREWQANALSLSQREASGRDVRVLLSLAQQLREQWVVRAGAWRTEASTGNEDAWHIWLSLIMSGPLGTPSPERTRQLDALWRAYQRSAKIDSGTVIEE